VNAWAGRQHGYLGHVDDRLGSLHVRADDDRQDEDADAEDDEHTANGRRRQSGCGGQVAEAREGARQGKHDQEHDGQDDADQKIDAEEAQGASPEAVAARPEGAGRVAARRLAQRSQRSAVAERHLGDHSQDADENQKPGGMAAGGDGHQCRKERRAHDGQQDLNVDVGPGAQDPAPEGDDRRHPTTPSCIRTSRGAAPGIASQFANGYSAPSRQHRAAWCIASRSGG
jgi:hypothetical protein